MQIYEKKSKCTHSTPIFIQKTQSTPAFGHTKRPAYPAFLSPHHLAISFKHTN